jgi:hypothetical protein
MMIKFSSSYRLRRADFSARFLLLQEKLRLAKEKKDVENMKQTGLCIGCRAMLQGGANQMVSKGLAFSQ